MTGHFCQGCGRESGTGPKWVKPTLVGLAFTVGAVVLGMLLGVITTPKRDAPGKDLRTATVSSAARFVPAPEPVWVPRVRDVFSGQVAVPRGRMVFYKFVVDAATMQDVSISGRFSAIGGMGNDIQVFITDEDGWQNLENNHPAPALYASGKTTVGRISPIQISRSGTYYLVFNNRFSMFTDKFVSGPIQLAYSVRQFPG